MGICPRTHGMGRKDMVLTVGRKDQGWIIDYVPRGRKVQALKPPDLEKHIIFTLQKSRMFDNQDEKVVHLNLITIFISDLAKY